MRGSLPLRAANSNMKVKIIVELENKKQVELTEPEAIELYEVLKKLYGGKEWTPPYNPWTPIKSPSDDSPYKPYEVWYKTNDNTRGEI